MKISSVTAVSLRPCISTTTTKCVCTPAHAQAPPKHTWAEICARVFGKWGAVVWLSKATLPRLSESHGPTRIGPSRSSLGNGGMETSSVAPDSQLPKHSRPAVRTHTHTQSSNPSQIITNLCVNMPFTCEQQGGGVLRRGGIASSLSWQILCYPRMTESCLHIYVMTGHGIGMVAIPAGWRGLLWGKIHVFNTSGKYMFASYRGAVAVCLSCE